MGSPHRGDLLRRSGAEREIEKGLDPALIHGGCLLCSEEEPHHSYRRLVAEYLNAHWGKPPGASTGLKALRGRVAGRPGGRYILPGLWKCRPRDLKCRPRDLKCRPRDLKWRP